MKHYNINIIGKVQGVFFRKTTCEFAAEMGVKGLVRNEPDGSVYIEAEAAEKTLNAFLVKCSRGPEKALVTNIYVEEAEVSNYTDFKLVD